MASQHSETRKKAKTVLAEEKRENLTLPLAPFHLLKKEFESKRTRDPSVNKQSSISSSSSSKELSTDGILKMARERLHQCNIQNFDIVPLLVSDVFDANPCLSSDKNEDLELAMLLQAAVLKFLNQQLDRARKLLNMCQTSASVTGNALHRVVHYFSVALQERISKEIGEVAPEAPEGIQKLPTLEEALTTLQPDMLECCYEIPFSQVTQFTSIQAILDNMETAKRIHILDLGIKSGAYWPIIMQALAGRHECPLQLLKITAVGPSKERIEEIGNMLSAFAETMNVPFEFKQIVSELKDLKEEFFEIATDEVLAVYSEMRLASLLPWPDHLESLVRTITKLNPCVMVITEIEANINTPTFLDRFDAKLSLCAAVFDCLEDCMDRENPSRALTEGVIWEGIRNIITSEGEERIHRQENLDFWRAFLEKFGIVQIAFSDLALCQSQMVVKRNPCWSCCAVEPNDKGLIVRWKGTAIASISVWKFQQDDITNTF